MKVAILSFFDQPCFPRDPAPFLDQFPIFRHFPRALADRGHTVMVFLHARHDTPYREGSVRYRFVRPSPFAQTLGRLVSMVRPSATRSTSMAEPAWRLIEAVHGWAPDVLHVHGTTMHVNLGLLRRAARPHHRPIVVHHHGGGLTPTALLRPLQRANLRAAAKLVVSTSEQGAVFVRDGGVRPERIAVQMETSSDFRPMPIAEARRITGMTGRPVFLSAARLHPIKDPMTLLAGFGRIAHVWPEAQLYLHYLTDELIEPMRAWVASKPALCSRVHFRGRLPLQRMEAVYNSADFLLQASRREFSGVAVLDAMACGATPVVTNLPSFLAMTDGGAHGLHFPPGDDEALADAVLTLSLEGLAARRATVRRHFERALSFDRMAAGFEAIYEAVVDGAASSPSDSEATPS